MLLLADRLGPCGQQDRDASLDPVGALQARVVEQVLVGEIEQAALIDRADENLEQSWR
jgi:hypothetical protein